MTNFSSYIKRFIIRTQSLAMYSWRFKQWGARSTIQHPDFILNPHMIQIGSKVEIRKGARLEARGANDGSAKICIGSGTSIHFYFHCGAFESVSIGNDVLIAGRVFITDHDHIFNNPIVPPLHAAWEIKPVVIEDGVWIGEGAAILKGVTVGRRSVIGANAVVTKNVPPFTIVGGVPARVIKQIEFESKT